MLNNYYNFIFRKKTLLIQIQKDIPLLVNRALKEDLGGFIDLSKDITSQILSKSSQANAILTAYERGVFCGKNLFEEVFMQLNKNIKIYWQVKDGDVITKNQILCKLKGSAQALLTGERTALNFLQTLCGVASQVRRYSNRLINTKNILILDTRKTLPGLRYVQKYAVLCGHGNNHRLNLTETFLIKENHIIAIGSITKAINAAIKLSKNIPIEIEVENIKELQEAIEAGANIVLLDNFSYKKLLNAIKINNQRVILGVSGNINLKNLMHYAISGINYISIGAITKNIQAIDLSMRFIK